MRTSKSRKADEVSLPGRPYSDLGENLRGNSQLLARLTIAIRALIQEHPCNDVGTKLLIMLMVKQQVNNPARIPDLRGLVSCQAIESTKQCISNSAFCHAGHGRNSFA
jgi:hypothetical protein